MDDHNVHQFWGISSALDLIDLACSHGAQEQRLGVARDINFLLVSPYDARHAIKTICQASRHEQAAGRDVHIYVYEETAEALSRHILLLSTLLDASMPAKQRVALLLELHGNVMLRESTSSYLAERSQFLEQLMVQLSSRSGAPQEGLGAMLDLSLLSYQARDALVDACKNFRAKVEFDMAKAWDTRCRRWYADRYDHRKNLIDWDYHMRLQPQGTPGEDKAHGSIIHFYHFRHWRMLGIAHEIRDAAYTHTNTSLLSTAVGRTKEFKDRYGKDVGRSVRALGFWGDILYSPFHSFGTVCDNKAFFKLTNQQFMHTAVDVAEYNLLGMLHELRTGTRYNTGGKTHRARAARGPTSLENLNDASKPAAPGGLPSTADQDPTGPVQAMAQAALAEEGAADGCAATAIHETLPDEAAPGVPPPGVASPADTAATLKGGEDAGLAKQADTALGRDQGAVPAAAGKPPAGQLPEGAADGACNGDAAAPATGAAAAEQPMAAGSTSSEAQESAAVPGDSQGAQLQAGGTSTAVAAPAADAGAASSSLDVDAQNAALLELEAQMDKAAMRRCRQFKLHLVTGDLVKTLTGRAKYKDCFSVLVLGHRHAHLAAKEYKLQEVARPGAVMAAESVQYMLTLKKEQVDAFQSKVEESLRDAGWTPVTTQAAELHQAGHRLHRLS